MMHDMPHPPRPRPPLHLPEHLSPMARQLLLSLSQAPELQGFGKDCQAVRQRVDADAAKILQLWHQQGVVFHTQPTSVGEVPCRWIYPDQSGGSDQGGGIHQGGGSDQCGGIHQGPLLLYFHGGGYISGSADTFLGLPQQIAAASRAVVLSVDYRLAPEHPFPAAFDDGVAVYRGLLDRGYAAASIGWLGDSAGGGLALATAHACRRSDLPLPAAIALLSPWIDLTLSGDSTATLRSADPFLSREILDIWRRAYADGLPFQDPRISPLFGDFADYPPMLIQSGNKEVLLSDALRLARRARHQGVDVDLDVWDGMWHVFQATPGLPEGATAIDAAGRFFARHLS